MSDYTDGRVMWTDGLGRTHNVPATDLQYPFDEIIDVREAAQFLRVSRNAVYQAVSKNEIPHVRIGRTIRFSRKTLEAWVDGRLPSPGDRCGRRK